eukprot:Pgem_evm1s7965
MSLNAWFSIFVYKPIVVIEYIRAQYSFSVEALSIFLFLQSFCVSLNNTMNCF